MANYGQYQQESTAGGGGWQAVVELCGLGPAGLMFWSRRRFPIGAEMVIRVRRDLLPEDAPAAAAGTDAWISLRGYVVDCAHMRREDGSQAFRVALLLDGPAPARSTMPRMDSRLPGLVRPGLN